MTPLVLTQGDPGGIGPELLLRVAAEDLLRDGDRVFADPRVLAELAARLGPDRPWAARGWATLARHLDRAAAPGMGQYAALVAATEAALASVARDEPVAMVTAPIDKARAQDEGLVHPGHTEFLAAAAGVEDFAMLMWGPILRVALATIHLPLVEVPRRLGVAEIVRVGRLLADALPHFGDNRRIGVLALNPHAGEKGRLGDEEIRVIAPAIEALRGACPGIEFVGPMPADTAFGIHARGELAAIVAMYHDQGLGPFKLLHGSDGINATLGLPFRRASPDHGTARDIAGHGVADPSSMFAAVAYARGRG